MRGHAVEGAGDVAAAAEEQDAPAASSSSSIAALARSKAKRAVNLQRVSTLRNYSDFLPTHTEAAAGAEN